MPSGGARARSGPPPDPNALRRDRQNDGEWTVLPADGRAGDPPVWPLAELTPRENEMWWTLWARPQAVQWERMGQDIEVALYVRRLVEAEEPGSPTALGTLVRQMADALGLTIPGMRVNRWKIAPVVVAPSEPVRRRAVKAPPSSRDRLRVVHGDAAG